MIGDERGVQPEPALRALVAAAAEAVEVLRPDEIDELERIRQQETLTQAMVEAGGTSDRIGGAAPAEMTRNEYEARRPPISWLNNWHQELQRRMWDAERDERWDKVDRAEWALEEVHRLRKARAR